MNENPSSRRVVAPLLLAAALAVGLASCASSAADDGAGTTTSAPTTVADTSTTTSAAPSSTTTSSTTTSTTTTSTTTTTTTPDQAIEPPGDLQSGSKGQRTKAVQEALKAMKYDPGEPDGSYGTKTIQAVWAFQALHGMEQTGVVTPDLEKLILAKPTQAMMRPQLGPTHTEADLTKQVLIVWKDGQPLLITHTSSGSGKSYCDKTKDGGTSCGTAITPLGLYKYQRRIAGWRDAPLGHLWNPVYFNGGIAVHGAPSVPAYPASHGCIRIPMHIANYFPDLVANGDTIEVFRS